MTKKNWILAIKIALVVGTALNLINNYEVISSFRFSMQNIFKITLTYCVPSGVSLYSSKQTFKS